MFRTNRPERIDRSTKTRRRGKKLRMGEWHHRATKKDAPSIKNDARGQSKRPWHRKAKDGDKTNVFAKRVVRNTSPDEDPGESARWPLLEVVPAFVYRDSGILMKHRGLSNAVSCSALTANQTSSSRSNLQEHAYIKL